MHRATRRLRDFRVEVASLEQGLAIWLLVCTLWFGFFVGLAVLVGATGPLQTLLFLPALFLPRPGWLFFRSRALDDGWPRIMAVQAVMACGVPLGFALFHPSLMNWAVILPVLSACAASFIALARMMEPEARTEVQHWMLPSPGGNIYTDSLGRSVRAPHGMFGPLYVAPPRAGVGSEEPLALHWTVRVGVFWRTLREGRSRV